MSKHLIFIFIFFLLFFSGCITVSMYQQQHFPIIRNKDQIEVFRTKTPNKDYIEICEIKCDFGFDNKNLQKAKEKASKVGAEAIVIIGGSGYSISGSSIEEEGLKAIAIKYK
jgi:hypothetical protein